MTIGYVEKEFLPQESDMQKINTFTRHEFSAESLYVFSAALCNNDVDRDYEKFSVEALMQLKEKFLGKTGICDHSMKAADQKARIFDTWVEKVDGKKTADGEDFYQLKAKAYMVRNRENEEFITEIEAGIKRKSPFPAQWEAMCAQYAAMTEKTVAASIFPAGHITAKSHSPCFRTLWMRMNSASWRFRLSVRRESLNH